MRVCVCVIPIGSNNDFCLACTGAPITIVDVSSMLYSTVVAC